MSTLSPVPPNFPVLLSFQLAPQFKILHSIISSSHPEYFQAIADTKEIQQMAHWHLLLGALWSKKPKRCRRGKKYPRALRLLAGPYMSDWLRVQDAAKITLAYIKGHPKYSKKALQEQFKLIVNADSTIKEWYRQIELCKKKSFIKQQLEHARS